MRFLLCAALPFVLSVLAYPVKDSARSVGLSVPISKRNQVRSADGLVNSQRFKASTQRSVMKILNGMANFESNFGQKHPLAIGSANELSKSDTDGEQHQPTLSHGQSLSSRSSPKKEMGEPLINSEDDLWYGLIVVGDPPRPFTVHFDTGSSDTFLPSISCTTGCAGHALYDPGVSDTSVDLNKTFFESYADRSSVSGEQYNDTLSIAGFTAYNQTLGAAFNYSAIFNKGKFAPDGRMGMAFQSISVYNAPPVFQTLVAQGQVTEPEFAFKFADTGGELTLGGTNAALYKGGFTYVPVTNTGFWQTVVDGAAVGGKPVRLNETTAIIDTGTTLLVGPETDVKAIYKQIPGAQPADPKYDLGEGHFTIPCNFNTAISFTFGRKAFPVSPKIFNLGYLGDGDDSICLGALVYNPNIGSWLFGDIFLRNVYTVFDLGKNRIGFADLASHD